MFEPGALKDSPLKVPRSDPMSHFIPFIQGPIMRTPVTDMMGNLFNAQEGPTLCANMEMMMLNCLDQYGYSRGIKMCGGYVQDLEECRLHNFERMRINIMEEERRRQHREGKREKRYEECPPHM